MSWNYRVLAKEFPCGTVEVDIYEVYYDNNGIPNAYSKNGVGVGGYDIKLNGLDDIRGTLKLMKKALDKPILWYGDDKFPQEYKQDE